MPKTWARSNVQQNVVIQWHLVDTHDVPKPGLVHTIMLPSRSSRIKQFVDQLGRRSFSLRMLQHWIPSIIGRPFYCQILWHNSFAHVVVFLKNLMDKNTVQWTYAAPSKVQVAISVYCQVISHVHTESASNNFLIPKPKNKLEKDE
jgi:hypothetical protein